MVNRLLPENGKSIPKFLSGKKLLKINPADFKFYLVELTNKKYNVKLFFVFFFFFCFFVLFLFFIV